MDVVILVFLMHIISLIGLTLPDESLLLLSDVVELGEVSWICGDIVGVVEQLLYPTLDNTWLRNLEKNLNINNLGQ